MNRTLVEAVRTMLTDAHLPKIFWAEAISTAVYLRNRSPTTAVTGKTPFEALTGKKPNVQNHNIFGCLAYSHVAKDKRQKLDVKSNKCIFLGYECNVKGYRLYDLNKKKVFVSRDVIFNEMQNISSQKESNVDVLVDENGSNIFKREDVNVSNLDVSVPNLDVNVPNLDVNVLILDSNVSNERSQRTRNPPQMYGDWVMSAENNLNEPENFAQAMISSESKLWKQSMQSETNSMQQNKVWDLVESPEGKNVLKTKWVFKKKLGPNGEVVKYKARLVAKGFSQKYSIDYNETFSPVSY